MSAKDRRYKTINVALDLFLDGDVFAAQTSLSGFRKQLGSDRRLLANESNKDETDQFYHEAMDKTIRPALENVTGIFLTIQNCQIPEKNISIADVAWIAETLEKITNLEATILSCIEDIDVLNINGKLMAHTVYRLDMIKSQICNMSTFVTMIIKRLTELLSLYSVGK
ncbi:MAG: hypothetical protein IKE01_01105 [Clostridia bacterium]|nr:hypothetical protein [Clostridia bacterium]